MKWTSTKRLHGFFYAIFICSMLFSAVYLAWNRGAGLTDFFYQKGTNLLGDFTNNLHYPTHEGGPYFDSCWASFPPLAYTFYYLVNVCFTRANINTEIVAYVVITAFSAMMLLYAMQRIFEHYSKRADGSKEAFWLSLCILLSGISIYTIERGNSVLNVVVLLLFAMYLRDSKQAWKREAALIIIAVATGIKVYPCLFGLLYLLERRFREAKRLLLYGIVFFFLPFIWFGGIEGIKQFLLNQQTIHALYRNDFLTSVPSIASFLSAELGWDIGQTAVISKAIAYVFGALLLVCVCLTRTLWMRCLLLVSLATLVPGWSAEYMAMYMIIPCALYFSKVSTKVGSKDVAYTVLFGGVFILLPFGTGFSLHAPVSWNMLVSFACIYLISFLAIGDVLFTFFRKRKLKNP